MLIIFRLKISKGMVDLSLAHVLSHRPLQHYQELLEPVQWIYAS